MNTFSCSLPYGMRSNPLPNALFWAICLQSWWQADLMETLKWLPLDPRSVAGSVRHPKRTQWHGTHKVIKVQSCLPAYRRGIALLALSLGLAADVSEHSCLFNVGTAPSLQGWCYRALQEELPRATATDTVQGILLIRWNGLAVRDALGRRLVCMEVLLQSPNRSLGVLLIWGLFWWERFTSTASPLPPK